MSTGADYAEVFAEHTNQKNIQMVSTKVDKIEDAVLADVVLRERHFGDIHPVKIVPVSVENSYKVDFLKEACFAAKEYHSDISQVTGTFLNVDHNILVANSEGLFAEDRQIRTRIAVSAIASKNGENQTGSCSPGARVGMELFELFPPKEVFFHTLNISQLNPCPPQTDLVTAHNHSQE